MNSYSFGTTLVNKDYLILNLNSNIDSFVEYRDYDTDQTLSFKDTLSYIEKGIQDNTITTNGQGRYFDSNSKLDNNNLMQLDAIYYVDTIIKKQRDKEALKSKEKEEVDDTKNVFKFNTHGLYPYIVNQFNPSQGENDNLPFILNSYAVSNMIFNKDESTDTSKFAKNLLNLIDSYINTTDWSKIKFDDTKMTKDQYLNYLNETRKGLDDGIDSSDQLRLAALGFNLNAIQYLAPIPRPATVVTSPTPPPLPPPPGDDKKKVSVPEPEGDPVAMDLTSSEQWPYLVALVGDLFALVDPEPLTAAALGIGSSGVTLYGDINNPNVSGWDATKTFAANVGLSAVGAVPFIGDALGSGTKIWKGFSKLMPFITTAIGSLYSYNLIDEGLYQGVQGVIDKAKTEGMDALKVDDWRTLYNGLATLVLTVNTSKSIKTLSNVNKHKYTAKIGQYEKPYIVEVTNSSGKTEHLALVKLDEIDFVLAHSKDPIAVRDYIMLKHPEVGTIKVKSHKKFAPFNFLKENEKVFYDKVKPENKKSKYVYDPDQFPNKEYSKWSRTRNTEAEIRWWDKKHPVKILSDTPEAPKAKTTENAEVKAETKALTETKTNSEAERYNPEELERRRREKIEQENEENLKVTVSDPKEAKSAEAVEPVEIPKVEEKVIVADPEPDAHLVEGETKGTQSNVNEKVDVTPKLEENVNGAPSKAIDDYGELNSIAEKLKIDDPKWTETDRKTIRTLLRALEKNSKYKTKHKNAEPHSAAYKQIMAFLKKNGMSNNKAKAALAEVGAYKKGGILKAEDGLKFNLPQGKTIKDYSGWDQFITYNEGTGAYDYNSLTTPEMTENFDKYQNWLKENNISEVTDPDPVTYEKSYGTGANKNQYGMYNTLYDPNAVSRGLVGARRNLRSESLGHQDTVFDSEVNLNDFWLKSKMYTGDLGNIQRAQDLANWLSNNYKPGMDINSLLSAYNEEVYSDYQFKRTAQALAYTGKADSSVASFNQRNLGRYKSLNEQDLHGYDVASEGVNGSETMSRSVDITDADMEVSPLEYINKDNLKDLYNLLANTKLYKDTKGYYYTRTSTPGTDNSSASSHIDVRTLNPKDDLKLSEIPQTSSSGPFLDGDKYLAILNYYRTLRHNAKQEDYLDSLIPLNYKGKYFYKYVKGNTEYLNEANRQEGRANSIGAEAITSNLDDFIDLRMKFFKAGQASAQQLRHAYEDTVHQSLTESIAQLKENLDFNYNVAMKNTENNHAVDREKLLARTTRTRSDYESGTNLINEAKRDIILRNQRTKQLHDYYYSKNLKNSIINNPSAYIEGWNDRYDRIWNVGNTDLALLDKSSSEDIIYMQLQKLALEAYDARMAKEYNIDLGTPSTKKIYRTWKPLITAKKGGSLKNSAALFLDFIKECNKNYLKDVGRSARGAYNSIKLQRKK